MSANTEGVAVAPDGSTVWLGSRESGSVTGIDTKSWKPIATLSGIGTPYRVGISPNGALAVIVDPKDDKTHIAAAAGAITPRSTPRCTR